MAAIASARINSARSMPTSNTALLLVARRWRRRLPKQVPSASDSDDQRRNGDCYSNHEQVRTGQVPVQQHSSEGVPPAWCVDQREPNEEGAGESDPQSCHRSQKRIPVTARPLDWPKGTYAIIGGFACPFPRVRRRCNVVSRSFATTSDFPTRGWHLAIDEFIVEVLDDGNGSFASVWPDQGDFQSTPVNGHSQDRRACFKGARRGSRERRSKESAAQCPAYLRHPTSGGLERRPARG